MKAQFPTSAQRERRQAGPRCGNDNTTALTEYMILEACVAQCESLALELSERDPGHPLFAQLSEAIWACEGYLAARARESRYAGRLAALASEVCATTARFCRQLGSEGARDCGRFCRMSVKLLNRHLPAALMN